MRKILRISFCLWLWISCIPNSALAHIYLVSNGEELRQALFDAQNNNENNTIYLGSGTYSIGDAGPFSFQSPHGHDLTLIGNSADSGATVLDGGNANQVLSLSNNQAGGTFTLQGLTLISSGPGLQVYNAKTRIEACEFVAFSAPPGPTPSASAAANTPGQFWGGNNGNGKNNAEQEAEAELQKSVQQAKGNWVLLGTAITIRNMDIFRQYNAVWAYQNGSWKAYSSRQDIKLRLHEQNIDELKQIPAYSGFWVWRD